MKMRTGNQRSNAQRAFAAVALGGVVGWVLAFAGLGVWGLVVGAASSFIVAVALARLLTAPSSPLQLAGFEFAFILLTWPPLGLIAGALRYLLTGQAVGQ